MTATKRTVEADDSAAATLEEHAAEAGLSASERVAGMVARRGALAQVSASDLAELDRQWAAAKAGVGLLVGLAGPFEQGGEWIAHLGRLRARHCLIGLPLIQLLCNGGGLSSLAFHQRNIPQAAA